MTSPTDNLTTEELIDVLAQSNQAIAIHVTDQFVIQYASDAMIKVWGKDRGVIGMPLAKALPELEGQPFIEMFSRVWHQGITISGKDTAAILEINGELKTFYFDFEYRPIKNETGETFCILHTATDITERYLSQQREYLLQEEMRAANEELSAANEELNLTNEELIQSQAEMQEINTALIESDIRFRNLVNQAPIGMCIIRAKDMWVEEVNDIYLELVGRDRHEVENRPIWEAIHEAAEAYAPVMQKVIDTGISYIAYETELTLIRRGVPETVFIDFVYEPIKFKGKVDSVLVIVIEVTEKVNARRIVEEMAERNRLAIEAAETGTYDIDLRTNDILTSPRFDTIFGFDEPVSWDEFATAIHPDDREARFIARQKAIETGKLFNELRIIHKDNSMHWVKVNGQVYFDADKQPVRMIGTVIDITEQKRLQQQKDDFLSIASHELKTPITTLKGSLQLLERMKNNPSPQVLPRLIDQAVKSMDKVSTLVEDLLNVGRANESQLRIEKTKFNITELLKNCCNHIRADDKFKIVVNAPEKLMVDADEHAIDQVITNLVNNAVKYAPNSVEIILAANTEGKFARISVQDFGPGIPEDKLPHLFERYYQVNASAYRRSGLGLGLYICSEIVKKHNGKIGVESELGKGSTFYFTLPLA
ncbi:MAG: PAS domain S-box protein [Bacteroidetes bacterium]|jgi:PAS domain S-box-containing protein|nr:PAS domain S-box protein [Bacteroidota bacterium]